MKFNYAKNQLELKGVQYSLDSLRDFLLYHDEPLCAAHKVKTIFRPGKRVTDSYVAGFQKRDIQLSGSYTNTYDWDCIFFLAKQQGLVEKFLTYENSSNRICSTQAVTV